MAQLAFSYDMFNIIGTHVAHKTELRNEAIVDLTYVPPGAYFLRVKLAGYKRQVIKIMK